MERYTINLNNDNEFEFLASVLATWDETSEGKLHKRSALDQLLTRSEIDGYTKERVKGNRNCLLWRKPSTDLCVYITRIKNGVYNVYVRTHNIRVRTLNIKEL